MRLHRSVAFPASISSSCFGKTHELGDCAVELGLWQCALGILIFSGSVPTRVSVEGFSSLFLITARAVIVAELLVLWRGPSPQGAICPHWPSPTSGMVVDFPPVTALALR